MAAFRLADRDLKRIVREDTKAAFNSDWQRAVRAAAARGEGGLQRAKGLRNNGSVRVNGGSPPQLMAYQSGQMVRGVKARDSYGAWEFAGRSAKPKRYVTRSPKGKRYIVNRLTQQQMPARQDDGYAVYPQVAEFGPRIVAYWVQSIVRAYYTALDQAGA